MERRFQGYWEATKRGHCFTSALRAKKAFLNPYLLEEVVSTFGIYDKGSCFPSSQWDPLSLPAKGHHQVLDMAQKQYEEDKKKRVGQGLPGSIKFGAEVVLEPPQVAGGISVGGVQGEPGGSQVKRSRFSEK